MTNNDSELDLGDLPRITQVLQMRMRQLHRADDAHRGGSVRFSDRLFDEAKPSGNRTYILASQLIGVAVENYQAVFALIQQGATPMAPYNLIRPAFEAAFYALWILEPEDGTQRNLRGLRVAVEDNRQRENWIKELIEIPSLTEDERQRLRAPIARASSSFRNDAAQLGATWAQASQRITLIDELRRLRHIRLAEPIVKHSTLAAWRQLSGFQHGHGYAIMSGSDHTIHTKIPGGVEAVITVNDEQFGLSMQIAALLQIWAIDTFTARTTP